MPSEAVLRRDGSVCSTVAARAGGLNTKIFAAKYIRYTCICPRVSLLSLYTHCRTVRLSPNAVRDVREARIFSSSLIIKIVNIYTIHSLFPFFHVEIHVMLWRKGCCRHSLRAHCTLCYVYSYRNSPSIHFTFKYFHERYFVAWQPVQFREAHPCFNKVTAAVPFHLLQSSWNTHEIARKKSAHLPSLQP